MKRTALAAALLAAACSSPAKAVRGTGADGIVVVASNVKDAQLFLDGRFVASLDALPGGVAVAPGTHRLELRHDAYFSSYLEVTVGKAERKQLSLDMAPILP
ncbi:MAG: PEGA domain-containing protein [Deltaproteobacteria bacterium]|nr:PEGA domain-containing protein [Deltaproteobacteria bacterium]MCW5808999.1 PEGA domain-containing protein [Deltaproteobacteria bacterium]